MPSRKRSGSGRAIRCSASPRSISALSSKKSSKACRNACGAATIPKPCHAELELVYEVAWIQHLCLFRFSICIFIYRFRIKFGMTNIFCICRTCDASERCVAQKSEERIFCKKNSRGNKKIQGGIFCSSHCEEHRDEAIHHFKIILLPSSEFLSKNLACCKIILWQI